MIKTSLFYPGNTIQCKKTKMNLVISRNRFSELVFERYKCKCVKPEGTWGLRRVLFLFQGNKRRVEIERPITPTFCIICQQ